MTEHSTLPHLGPVRFSRLKQMAKCPEIYRAQFDHERPDNAAMRFGRLVHAVVLGGKVAVFDGKRSGKKWDKFESDNAGSEIALVSEFEEATRINAKIQRHPYASKMLVGKHECEIAWMSEGRACGARLDVLGDDYVTDLKTTASAEPGWFTRNGARMGYHAQLDWYRLGATLALGKPIEGANFVAVETKYPYVITTMRVPGHVLDKARGLWRKWWECLKVCEESDVWPAYAQEPVDFEPHEFGELDFGDDA